MPNRQHKTSTLVILSVVALIATAAMGWISKSRTSVPPLPYQVPNANELDIDLAAGTPLPPLPTAQPMGWSIVSADQALAQTWARFHGGDGTGAVVVRLVNNGIVNQLCERGGGGLMPESDLVWAVAYTQRGLTDREIRDEGLPMVGLPFLAFESPTPGPSPTAAPTATPMPVAGAYFELRASDGLAQDPLPLFFADTPGHACWTLGRIQALRSLPDVVQRLPTTTPEPFLVTVTPRLFEPDTTSGATPADPIDLP